MSTFVFGSLAYATSAQAQSTQYAMDSTTYVMQGGLTAQAIGTETAYYDSNPLLLTTGARGLWGSVTSPELVLGDKTQISTIASDTIFINNNFNQSAFDSNDVHSKLNVSKQLEHWSTSFQGTLDYDTTRTSELSNYNHVNTAPVRHLGESLSPQISYNFLSTDKLSLAGNYSESQYANTVFTNYNSYSISPSYSHTFDPLNIGVLSLEAQRYNALNNGKNLTDTVGPSIGWQKIFSERLNGTVNVGFQETRQETAPTPNPLWQTQYNYSGALHYTDIQDLMIANVSRSQYPFGNGTEALLTQFSLSETHDITPLFSLNALGSYQSATYQSNANGNIQSITTGSGGLIYHATDCWDFTATYEYQQETLIGATTGAQKNIGMLSIAYHPQAWTL